MPSFLFLITNIVKPVTLFCLWIFLTWAYPASVPSTFPDASDYVLSLTIFLLLSFFLCLSVFLSLHVCCHCGCLSVCLLLSLTLFFSISQPFYASSLPPCLDLIPLTITMLIYFSAMSRHLQPAALTIDRLCSLFCNLITWRFLQTHYQMSDLLEFAIKAVFVLQDDNCAVLFAFLVVSLFLSLLMSLLFILLLFLMLLLLIRLYMVLVVLRMLCCEVLCFIDCIILKLELQF